MAYVFKQLNRYVLNKLLPPATGRLFSCPFLDVKLTETSRQVHDSHSDNLRLPLQRQHGAQAVVDKGPCHLQHFAHFILITFELFDVTQQEHVGVLHLQVKLNSLEQDSLQHHHFFLWVITKLGKLHIIQ